MSEKDTIIDNANVLDCDYDDEETSENTILESTTEKSQNVQLSLEPTIQEEEEKKLAQIENHKHQLAILEGLLFLTGDEGLTVEQASLAMEIKEEEIVTLFDELQKYYVSDERGFEIERFGKTYRFLSKAIVHPTAKKLFANNSEVKLSNAALETLAIIAYKQPITRVEIEEIRGVGADVMLHKLEARGFIQEDGRSEAPGRPILYRVTEDFMDAFQLVSLDELPELPNFNDHEGSDDLFTQ